MPKKNEYYLFEANEGLVLLDSVEKAVESIKEKAKYQVAHSEVGFGLQLFKLVKTGGAIDWEIKKVPWGELFLMLLQMDIGFYEAKRDART